MTARITLALAQVNPVRGGIGRDAGLVRRRVAEAASCGADLVVLPELALLGCVPGGLGPEAAAQAEAAMAELAAEGADGGPALVLGGPWRDGAAGLHNAACLLQDGRVAGRVAKHRLAVESRLDERRHFVAGAVPGPLALRLPGGETLRLGVMLGQDMAGEDVAEALAESGAEMLLVLARAPFAAGGQDHRLQLAVARVTETGLPLLFVNQVGGEDGLVFEGGSFALDARCRLVAQAAVFEEELLVTRWERGADEAWAPVGSGRIAGPVAEPEASYRALLLGLADRVRKGGHAGALVALAGEPWAALALALAVDALGPERVRAVAFRDPAAAEAAAEARRLGVRVDAMALEPAVDAFRDALTALGAPPSAPGDRERLRALALATLAEGLGLVLLDEDGSGLRDAGPALRQALAGWRSEQRPAV